MLFLSVSSSVQNVSLISQDNSTMVLSWLPPATPGDIGLSYTVRIVFYSSGATNISENTVITTFYTATNLGIDTL